MKIKKLFLLLFLVSATFLCACSGGNSSSSDDQVSVADETSAAANETSAAVVNKDGDYTAADAMSTAAANKDGDYTAADETSAAADNKDGDYAAADEMSAAAVYKDGEYTASATGYSGGLKVKVTIEDSNIQSIEIVSHNEVGKQYYEEAIEKIPQAIVDAQSTEIDIIAGATKTSKGIIKAVNKALEEAKLK